MAYRVSDKFVIPAIEQGTVLEVTDKVITINYKNKGMTKVVLKEWTTKEESNSTYTHKLVTILKKGMTVNQGDVIAYDYSFFEPDIFDSKKVVFKSGSVVNTVLMEDMQTFEDSSAISYKAAKKLATNITKVKSIVVNNTDAILDIVTLGQKVEPTTIAFSISDASLMKLKGLTPEALEAIKRLKQASPKIKYKGTVTKIHLYYNSEYEDLSESIKLLVDTSDKNVRIENNNKTYNGRVDNGYSIQGKPLLEGQVEIKIYIDVKEEMGVGDKMILSNQLKSTVGEVFDYNMSGIDGTEIEAVFSARSIAARIVSSPFIIGTTTKVLEVLTDRAIETYFNEK